MQIVRERMRLFEYTLDYFINKVFVCAFASILHASGCMRKVISFSIISLKVGLGLLGKQVSRDRTLFNAYINFFLLSLRVSARSASHWLSKIRENLS